MKFQNGAFQEGFTQLIVPFLYPKQSLMQVDGSIVQITQHL